MLRRWLFTLVAIVFLAVAVAPPALAQSQGVSFNVGRFNLRGVDSRNDVLFEELNGGFYDALDFNIKDFNNVTFGADWLLGLSDYLEAGLGVAYYSRSVPSRSLNFVDLNDNEITQDLRLRIVPITATIRFLPLGRHSVVEPYIGAGIGIFGWRYSETGRFVFAPGPGETDASIIPATYEKNGWNAGPVVVGGARVPFGQFSLGGELRWQKAHGTLPTTGDNSFLSDRLDLGGVTYQVTFGVRF